MKSDRIALLCDRGYNLSNNSIACNGGVKNMTVRGLYQNPGQGDAYWVLGDLYTFKAVSQDTGGAYALIELVIQPQRGVPPHIHHHEDEACYIQEGEFEFQLDDRTVVATPGTFLHSPKGQCHSFTNIGTTPGKMLCWATPGGLERLFVELGTPATDEFAVSAPLTPPDLEKLVATASQYGLEIVPPPDSTV